MILAIAGIVFTSSMYDFRCKTTHGLDHYRQDLPSTRQMYLVSFSIIRNWYRITSRGDDQLSHDLRYIHTIRMIVFMGVTLGHVVFYAQPRTALTIESVRMHARVYAIFDMISFNCFPISYHSSVTATFRL